MSEIATLRLGPFDSHGTTRGHYRGRSIEVEHGIPGETVEAEITGGPRPRGKILRILDPSPDRVLPPCPYFRDWACGGCQWQQISYESQLERKREAIDRAWASAGLDLRVREVHALEDPWRYRSTAGVSLGKRAGFRRHGSLAIVPIHDCPISHPLIGQLMASVNDALEDELLPDFRGRLRIDVRTADGPEGEVLQLLVRPTEDGKHPDPDNLATLITMLTTLPFAGGISVLRPDGTVETVFGELFAITTIAGRPVSLAAGSFFQTNVRLVPELIARIRQEAEPLAGKRVADVYAGVGIFGLFLAEGAREVTIIESDPLAVEAARRTAALWGLDNVRFVTKRAEDAVADIASSDVLLVDPPRSGLTDSVKESLIETRASTLLYVSCLAESLARDLCQFSNAGYAVDSIELYDFYPQTYHVEMLAVLRG